MKSSLRFWTKAYVPVRFGLAPALGAAGAGCAGVCAHSPPASKVVVSVKA
jgi:hypothetical protein